MEDVCGDENWQILKEVFALIDSYDDVLSEEVDTSDGEGSKTKVLAPVKEKGLLVKSKKKSARSHSITAEGAPRKKRIRRPETSSTAFQRRKNFELMTLRQEVSTLENELDNLKLKKQEIWEKYLVQNKLVGKGGSQSQTMAFTWCEEVLKQHRRRVESENLNRKLKEIAARQTEMSNTIFSVFQQQDTFYVSVILTLSNTLAFVANGCVEDGYLRIRYMPRLKC
ncbi:hypothetical protein PHMEG_00026435 [Phytophthora megakarya]|uniref:Uncharacterized protein n=1 Tax=Phytophthora megakarya TaxID=4795 RepID=A0A225VB00_9STRA|nr:hypothetical protein PHMEG_00026435 [Phytophthora megakarya]